MNNCGIFMRKYRYIHILLNCKNVGMDTGLCVSMCKWMSVFESCYCTKAPQTMQIITVDALVKNHFHLTSICKNFLQSNRFRLDALMLNDNNFLHEIKVFHLLKRLRIWKWILDDLNIIFNQWILYEFTLVRLKFDKINLRDQN